ncbi:MAG: hypothetical protein VW016_10070 [Luminiphilus sp.]
MAQHRIVEIDYHDFMSHLRAARDAKRIIEPRDTEKWAEYVNAIGLREAAFAAHARVKFTTQKPKMVAIVGEDPWAGSYYYSTDDESAIKYVIL